MELISADSNDEIYTGMLRYKDDDYQFVLAYGKLRLVPLSKEKRSSMWKFGLKQTTKGTYIPDEPPRMEEDILVGNCYENSKQIIFLPKKGHIFLRKI